MKILPSFIKKLGSDLIDLFYPRLCLGCEGTLRRNESFICLHCYYYLARSGDFENRENELEKTFQGRLPLKWAAALYRFRKKGRVQNLIHNIKYRGQNEAAKFIGEEYGRALKNSALNLPEKIVPVPLHKKKLKERGFNQSTWFAYGIASQLGVPVLEDALKRNVYTETQTKKSRYERWKNVGEIFSLDNPDAIKNCHLLLVDDIVTSGATMEACGIKLLEAENVQLSIGVIGKAS